MIVESERRIFPTEESVEEAFKKMDAAVSIINTYRGLETAEAIHILSHNKAHLNVMVLYQTIKQSGRDLSNYIRAITT